MTGVAGVKGAPTGLEHHRPHVVALLEAIGRGAFCSGAVLTAGTGPLLTEAIWVAPLTSIHTARTPAGLLAREMDAVTM